MKALVSIIIPVFNGAGYIQQCLESLLIQSYSNIEAIIVDDGSTDGLEQIADEMIRTDSRIRFVRIDNSGVTAARKRGLDEARGKWICFLDVDDTMPSNAIENYSIHFESRPDIIASGEPTLTLEEYKCGLMRRKSHPELWGKAFRADFIKEYYPVIDRSITVGEDQIINLVLANHASRLVTIPELQYRYNLDNPESVMKRFNHTAEYEIKYNCLFDSLVRPGFHPYSDAIQLAEYKMKIEGFKTIVLDGNRFDPKCEAWLEIKRFFRSRPSDLAPSERMLIRLERLQVVFEGIMKIRRP